MPANAAVSRVTSPPPKTDFNPNAAISFFRSGAMGTIPPNWMAMDEKDLKCLLLLITIGGEKTVLKIPKPLS